MVQFIRQTGMISLVTAVGSSFQTTAVPVLVEDDDGKIVLSGHMPQVNPHSKDLCGARGLALCQGPQAYVRPGWYPSKQRDARTTPTWDHITVTAEGVIETYRNKARLIAHVEAMSNHFEKGFPDPWSIDDAPESFISALAGALIGFDLHVERLTGIWKLHQNHPVENRLGVIAGLRTVGGAGDLGIAAAMEDGIEISGAGI